MPDPLKVAIYARVSRNHQDVDMQLNELRAYCLFQKWNIVKEYVDPGFTGKNSNRPGLQSCISDARKRKFKAILVWKLDRWGRSVSQLANDVLLFSSLGVRFICPGQGIDTDVNSPMSGLLLNILAAFAQFERELDVERVVSGIRRYKDDYEAGRIGRTKHSRSKQDLPHGRPAANLDEIIIRNLASWGLSTRSIATKVGSSKSVIQRALKSLTISTGST